MKEIVLSENALITSKTDLKGNIIYANNDFLNTQVIKLMNFCINLII